MPKKYYRSINLALIFVLMFIPITNILAQFNPGYILSDAELIDYDSMYMGQIQDFLSSKDSYLAAYVDPSLRITAAQAIYDSARLHKINPKYILVLLQKEQSLIVDGTPSQDQLDWATGYGICDGCKKTDDKVQKYKGFVNQVDWGAGGTRFYFDNPDGFKYQVGNTYTIGTDKVTISNDATRALYIYTPYVKGNESFYNIWQSWFGSVYLDGSLLQNTEDGGIWLLKDGIKYPFLSKAAFLSRYSSFDKVIPVNPAELEKYSKGQAIEYPNYSLLQIPTGGIYLLNDDTLRPIASREDFRLLGFNPEEVIPLESKDIFYYKIGRTITAKDAYPTGAVLKDKTTDKLYYIESDVKYPIVSKELIDIYHADKTITVVSTEELDGYRTGQPIRLKDGELVVAPSSPAVYVITGGLKRPFSSAEAFEGRGYKWTNIVRVEDAVLALHDTGEMIDVMN